MAITSVLYSATVVRCPDIRFIWSHGGGAVPYITSRLAGAESRLPKGLISYTLPSFKKLVPPSHILFGTDFPFAAGSAAVAKGLKDNGGFSTSELRLIDRDNAVGLFPRLNA